MSELGVTLALFLASAGVGYWIWRQARSSAVAEGNQEAYKQQNTESQKKIGALQGEVLLDEAERAREDRRRADEIVRARNAAGARDLLRDSAGGNS